MGILRARHQPLSFAGHAESIAMVLSLLLFLLGFLICVLLTPWVIRLAQRANLGLDAPDETRKRHAAPIPRLGGMPIMCALSIGLLLILTVRPDCATSFFPVLLGSLLMCGLGLWDDFKPLGARKKTGRADRHRPARLLDGPAHRPR